MRIDYLTAYARQNTGPEKHVPVVLGVRAVKLLRKIVRNNLANSGVQAELLASAEILLKEIDSREWLTKKTTDESTNPVGGH